MALIVLRVGVPVEIAHAQDGAGTEAEFLALFAPPGAERNKQLFRQLDHIDKIGDRAPHEEAARGLAVSGADVEREAAPRRNGRQPLEQCRRRLGPIPLIGLRLARKMILERRRFAHVAGIVHAPEKNAPGFWPGAEVRTFGEGKEVR